MEEKKQEQQYYVDVITAAMERTVKRLWIVVLVLIVLLAATNGSWIWYESQWQTVQTTTIDAQQETDGGKEEYIENLRDMMEQAPDDQTRQSIQRMIQQMEMA